MKRTMGILLAAATLVAAGCRGEEDDRDAGMDAGTNPDLGGGGGGNDGGMVTGDCPMGQGSAFTVCELKLDGNPRQPPLGDPIEVADVVVTTSPFSLTQTATSGVNGFYVQDRQTTDTLNGRYSGIVVTYFPDSTMSVPSRGDVISVTGTFRDFGQMGAARQKQIQLASFTANGTDTPAPLVIADAATISTVGSDASAYEGVLVEVQNVTAIQTRDIPGAGGSSIFGAFQVTGGLIVRNLLADVRADMGETFSRIAGILAVGTAPFDAGVYALLPRDGMDVESTVMAVRSIPTLQDPTAAGRPSICTQRGGVSTRMGTCPRVRFDDVVITAVDPGMSGRANLWVQDPSVADGRYAGIRVFNARIEGMGAPTVGDRVSVEGVAVLFFDALQIDNATATLTGSGAPIDPVTVMPSDIPGMVQLMGSEVANPFEGVLVQIDNVAVTNRCVESNGDRGYFEVANTVIVGNAFDYAYNGEAPMNSSDPGPCSAMPRPMDMRMVGDQFQSISGIMDYSFNQFRLNPRSDADLVGN